MNKFTLSALVATALWATAFTPALSQAKKPQAAPAASNVVGSVNGKPLTWDEVFAKLRAENPDALSQALGAAAGDKVAKSLFGPQPAAQVTITRADVLKSMTAKPPQVITNVVQVMLRDEALRQQIITDGHAPDMYRVATVRNLDPWYPAFDVKPGQKLYLDPKDRVRVW